MGVVVQENNNKQAYLKTIANQLESKNYSVCLDGLQNQRMKVQVDRTHIAPRLSGRGGNSAVASSRLRFYSIFVVLAR